tara:strand:+ start:11903 stop:12148 length:246 start_codon:yes stop_codon:yes gene_type:complete
MKTKKTKTMKTRIEKITLYSYKAWWKNPQNQKKKLTSYSCKFETVEAAKKWYLNFGKALEKKFKRELIFSETIITKEIELT